MLGWRMPSGKKNKLWEYMVDREDRVRQEINVIFKEPIYKILTSIQDKQSYRKTAPWEEIPKNAISGRNVNSMRKRGTKLKIVGP